MDIEQIGGLIGASAASFLASWAISMRTIRRKLVEQSGGSDEPRADVEVVTRTVDELRKQQHEFRREIRHAVERIEARCTTIEQQIRNCVTSDEFVAYTTHETQAINQLTEKVGRVTGVLEAWTRQK